MAKDLLERGYTKTSVLLGGVAGWKRAGFPTVRAGLLDRCRWSLLLLRYRFRPEGPEAPRL